MKRSIHWFALVAAAGLAVVSAGPVGAAVIQIAVSHDSGDVAYDTSLEDNNGDTDGSAGTNLRFGNSPTLYVGEWTADAEKYPTDLDDVDRVWVPFSLSQADRAAVLSAQSVVFKIRLAGVNNVSAFHLDLLGYLSRTDPQAVAGDYEATDVQMLKEGFATSATSNGYLTLDVTSFAKAQAAAPNSIIAFRLQLDGTPDSTDGNASYYKFNAGDHSNENLRPFLEVTTVPEPSAALLGLGGAGTLLGARRRRRTQSSPC